MKDGMSFTVEKFNFEPRRGKLKINVAGCGYYLFDIYVLPRAYAVAIANYICT